MIFENLSHFKVFCSQGKRKLNKYISKEIASLWENYFLVFNLIIQNVPVPIQ